MTVIFVIFFVYIFFVVARGSVIFLTTGVCCNICLRYLQYLMVSVMGHIEYRYEPMMGSLNWFVDSIESAKLAVAETNRCRILAVAEY